MTKKRISKVVILKRVAPIKQAVATELVQTAKPIKSMQSPTEDEVHLLVESELFEKVYKLEPVPSYSLPRDLVHALLKRSLEFRLDRHVLSHAIQILKNFLEQKQPSDHRLELFCWASVLIASKIEEVRHVLASDLTYKKDFDVKELIDAEKLILNTLKWSVRLSTRIEFTLNYGVLLNMNKLQLCEPPPSPEKNVMSMAQRLAYLSCSCCQFSHFCEQVLPESLFGIACLRVAFCVLCQDTELRSEIWDSSRIQHYNSHALTLVNWCTSLVIECIRTEHRGFRRSKFSIDWENVSLDFAFLLESF